MGIDIIDLVNRNAGIRDGIRIAAAAPLPSSGGRVM